MLLAIDISIFDAGGCENYLQLHEDGWVSDGFLGRSLEIYKDATTVTGMHNNSMVSCASIDQEM